MFLLIGRAIPQLLDISVRQIFGLALELEFRGKSDRVCVFNRTLMFLVGVFTSEARLRLPCNVIPLFAALVLQNLLLEQSVFDAAFHTVEVIKDSLLALGACFVDFRH